MSARRRRSAFAAPLVVTLAFAPACILRTGSPAPQARPAGDDHRGDPVVAANPPRPVDGTAGSAPPPSNPGGRPPHADAPTTSTAADQGPPPTPPIRQTDGSTDVAQTGPSPGPDANLRSWTVHQRADKTCYAMHPTQCPPPPSTCNPPPPVPLKSCPAGMTQKTTVNVRELSPGECFVMHAAPACPAGVSCNPPRPTEIDCPTY